MLTGAGSARRGQMKLSAHSASHADERVEPSSLGDGFTVLRRQACDQRKGCSPNNFRVYSPQIADHSRLQPDTPVNEARSSATRHNVKPDAADPGHHGCLPGHRPPNSSWDVRAASGASPVSALIGGDDVLLPATRPTSPQCVRRSPGWQRACRLPRCGSTSRPSPAVALGGSGRSVPEVTALQDNVRRLRELIF